MYLDFTGIQLLRCKITYRMDNLFRAFSVLSLLLALMLEGNEAADEKIPVLIWSNDESVLRLPDNFAGHTVNQAQFKSLYLDKLLEDKSIKTLAVFVQDQLTAGEISINADVYASADGGAFKHTKDLVSTLHSAFLSKVSAPVTVLKDLDDRFPARTYKLKQPYDLGSLDLDPTEKNLVIIYLPTEQGTSKAAYAYLQNVDNILNNVTLQLQNLPEHFAALYTGRKTHEHTSFDQHSGRHLLQTLENSENATAWQLQIPNLFLIYAKEISFFYGVNSTQLSTQDADWNVTVGDDCPPPGFNQTSNLTCSLALHYQLPFAVDSYELQNFSLNFVFATTNGSQAGYWYLEKFFISYRNESVTQGDFIHVVLDERFVDWTPFHFSYHCHENPPIRPKGNQSEYDVESIYLSFKAFQVQVFYVNGTFGYYNDCVGFFTIPIWSAIICCAVMLAILFFGIVMLMSIKTMDRMDDPKGKTISVTVAD